MDDRARRGNRRPTMALRGLDPSTANLWTSALPPSNGERRSAPRRGAAELADGARTADVPATSRPGASRRRWPLVGVALAVFGLAMGSAGYLLGLPLAAAVDAERAPSPFGNGGSFSVPGFGSLPGFGNGARGGGLDLEHRAGRRRHVREGARRRERHHRQRAGDRGGHGHRAQLGGLVLTNNHVVDGATSISVTDLGNGQTYQANVLGYDVHRDVALIQLVGASGLATPRSAARRTSVRPSTRWATRAARAGRPP